MSCNVKLRALSVPECDPAYKPLPDKVILDHFRNAQHKANRYREEIIFNRLKQLGFSFTDNEEKEKFASERLVFMKHDRQHPDWRELYLFPEMTFIGSWWETVEFETFTGIHTGNLLPTGIFSGHFCGIFFHTFRETLML